MSTKGRVVPRVVCCAIPIERANRKVLVITSRKRQDRWVCELAFVFLLDRKTHNHPFCSTERWLGSVRFGPGGSGLAGSLGRRSQPLSLSPSLHLLIHFPPFLPRLVPCCHCAQTSLPITAGVRGKITRYVTTIESPSTTYHFYELDVSKLDEDWLERGQRTREWVDYAEAVNRVAWKAELAQGLMLSSLAPPRR